MKRLEQNFRLTGGKGEEKEKQQKELFVSKKTKKHTSLYRY